MSVPLLRQRAAYAYALDPSLIAQSPATPRDAARLLVYDRTTKETAHERFSALDRYLKPHDLLVVNTTRVLPARLFPCRLDTGTKVEILLLRARTPDTWETLVKPGRRLRPGAKLVWEDGTVAAITDRLPDGLRLVTFSREVDLAWLEEVGAMPLPPYIRRAPNPEDKGRYQTVYATQPGAIAAPTAGLHFTDALLARLEAQGIGRAPLVLHIAQGTFRPVRSDDIAEHPMDPEWYDVPAETLDAIRATRRNGGRIVAVGTTSVRTLETLAETGQINAAEAVSGWTRRFIYPPYRFRLVDALITNFHLPESTLLMLVCAFAGREETLSLYRQAVEMRYRFYSYGDAMLIL